MLPSLPKPVADYFAADADDGPAVAACFAEKAVIIDEKQTHEGRRAIARWKSDASAKYDYISEPLSFSDRDGEIIVMARLTGSFPGSPVDLRYTLILAGNVIARLEIAP